MRRTNTVRIGDLWDEFLRSSPAIARKIAEAKAADHWPAVAGVVAARYTLSVDVKNGIMCVKLSSSVMRSELFMRRASLRDEINRAVGMDVIRELIIK